MSSANVAILVLVGMSEGNIRNIIGPSTLPCGTSEFIVFREKTSLTKNCAEDQYAILYGVPAIYYEN